VAKDRLAHVLERWEAVIGLEVHTELTTLNTKMFCGCPVAFGGEPNTRVCPSCLGLPGALPVPNQAAVEATVLAGLATGCTIAERCQFHRKNYFYPDMPNNYQISQLEPPFCAHGHVDIDIEQGSAPVRPDRAGDYTTRIGITRIHLEEDTGKMVHVGGTEGRIAGATHSLVDFNRAGTALIELVTDPDIRTPEEARRFAQTLRLIWRTLGISDCSMEEGSMRVDGNVSVRPRGESALGTKAEIKNMNSFKSLHDALAYEIVRQAEMLEDGGTVVQETRHWDAGAKRTSGMRSKETAHDYRYFADPDLVPFELSAEWVESVRGSLPELPQQKKQRFMADYGVSPYEASVLVGEDLEMAEFFEATITIAGLERAKAVSNIMLNELSMHLNAVGIGVAESKVVPSMVAELVALVEEGAISGKQAKEVFAEMAETGDSPGAIVELRGMKQVSDSDAIEKVVDHVLAASPAQVEQYRGGKTTVMGYFVGQVMREMRGQANPKVVNDVLARKLGGADGQ
jgi:aspartyl-tRNA(Asn)/glutamyl-tRNA(Gln) amidotransferase subunit B